MPLKHLTVLDLTHMLSGPYGTMLLADMGARVIKVEPPKTGEGTRRLLENSPLYSIDGMGAYYVTLNRNKESVCIDLKQPEGKAVFMDLVKKADIVFDNFSVGVTKRLGIDYDSLSKVNPKIITCSVTGFGSTGPETELPAFDQVVQAMGGGMSITGSPETGPLRSGIPIGDLGGGIFGALGVLAAVAERGQTGLGQHVDVSMLDVQISLLNYMATMQLMSGINPTGIGNSHFVHVPYNSFATSDGYIIIACIGDSFFEKFAKCMDIEELKEPSYLDQSTRYADREKINDLIAQVTKTNTTEFWLKFLRKERIPCAPVNTFEQAMDEVQVKARDMIIEIELDSGKTVKMPGNPVKLSNHKSRSPSRPPKLSEQTIVVLNELLNYSEQQINNLKVSGIIE